MMADLKSFVLNETEFMIDVLKNELKKCNTRSNDTNEYRYGQIGSLKKSLVLLKEFKKMVNNYGVEEISKPIKHKDSISIV
jgi:hypothetical protein